MDPLRINQLRIVIGRRLIEQLSLGCFKLVLQGRNLQILEDDSLVSVVKALEQLPDLLLVQTSRLVVVKRAFDKFTARLGSSELVGNLVLHTFGLLVDCAGLVVARLGDFGDLHLFHFLLHLFDVGFDAATLLLDLGDPLVHIIRIISALLIFLAQMGETLDEVFVLFGACRDVILGLLELLLARLLQLPNLLLHVLEVLVKLVDQLRILLLLRHELLGLPLHVRLVNVHELLHLVCIVRLLHRPLNVLDKVLDLVLFPLRHDLCLLTLAYQVSNRVLLRLHVLLHLSETFGLHLKKFL